MLTLLFSTMYAREAREQQANADPDLVTKKRGYPSAFQNHDNNLKLSTPGSERPTGKAEWVHQPLIPGRIEAWRYGMAPGGVRGFYTRGNAMRFDVGYHDPKKGPKPGGKSNEFSLATYHAATRARSDEDNREQESRLVRYS